MSKPSILFQPSKHEILYIIVYTIQSTTVNCHVFLKLSVIIKLKCRKLHQHQNIRNLITFAYLNTHFWAFSPDMCSTFVCRYASRNICPIWLRSRAASCLLKLYNFSKLLHKYLFFRFTFCFYCFLFRIIRYIVKMLSISSCYYLAYFNTIILLYIKLGSNI